MRHILTAAVLLLILTCFSSCFSGAHSSSRLREPDFPKEYQVKNHTDGEISAFGLNIATADEMGEWVSDWTDQVIPGEGFQYYIYADPDSWDVYLYYPKKQGEIQLLSNENVSVEYSDHTLHVYVTFDSQKAIPQDLGSTEETWILHLWALPFGAWPSEIQLYYNDSEIILDGTAISS